MDRGAPIHATQNSGGHLMRVDGGWRSGRARRAARGEGLPLPLPHELRERLAHGSPRQDQGQGPDRTCATGPQSRPTPALASSDFND